MSRNVDAGALVGQYLRELELALRDLGEEHPDEAVAEIRAHLQEGLGGAEDPDQALRLMVDLGRPEQVAASLLADRSGGLVPAPRPLTTAALVLDAIIALTPLVVLLLTPVYALIDVLEVRALTGNADVGLGGAERLILGVPALLGIVWAVAYLVRARRPAGSISRQALGLDVVRRDGRVIVVQTPTAAGRAARQRRARLVRLLLTVTVFMAAVTTMIGWALSYNPQDAAERMGGLLGGEARLMEAEARTTAVLDDYYDALRRRDLDMARSYYGLAEGPTLDELYPADLLADFAYEESLGWEMRSQDGIDPDSEPLVIPYMTEVVEYFGDPAHPDRRRVVTYSLEYRAERPDYTSEIAEVRWMRVSVGPLENLQ